MFEELLALGKEDAEYDAWLIKIHEGEQFGSGFTGGSRFTGHFGGTSSATPLVAGVAALVISANPQLTGGEVKAILEETADKIEDQQPDPVLGLQKGTYDANGHSNWQLTVSFRKRYETSRGDLAGRLAATLKKSLKGRARTWF